MNLKPSDNDLREAVYRCVDDVRVPAFDLVGIRTHNAVRASAPPPRRGALARRLLVAVPVTLVLTALLANMPSVIAQMERALHAFAVVDGRVVPLQVRAVTLDEARAQMPFRVIPPASVPANLRMSITALSASSAPGDAHLVFQYYAGGDLPVLTIAESSAAAKGPTKVMMTENRTVRGRAAPKMPLVAPQPGTGPHEAGADVMRNVELRRINGRTTTRSVTMHPVSWVTNGTRIVLAAPPGTLTPRQVDAIRAAMSE